ncbi:MAG: protein phosphatase 2C domain-containing protein [Myxococcota bacterium]
MQIVAAAHSHVGRRSTNEDAFLVAPKLGLYVVADGMGGYEGGEVASRLVVESLRDFFAENSVDPDLTWPVALDPAVGMVANELFAGVMLAQRVVLKERNGRLQQMGSTVVAVALDVDQAIIAHLGDSRAYRFRDGVLEQLTRDHSYAELLRASGGEVPPGFGHVITRAIGRPEEGPPEMMRTRLRARDRLLLCSDGLSDVLSADEMTSIFRSSDGPEDLARCLVEEAYVAGGSDNITALVLEAKA